MKPYNLISACALLAASLGFAAPAMATPMTFSINDFVGSGNPAAGPYGTVTLTQNGSNVDVDLTLNSCCGFVSTGAGDALLFNLKEASITIGGSVGSDTAAPGPAGTTNYTLNTTNYTLVGGSGTTSYSATGGSIHTGGGGDFDYAIKCTGCGSGGSGLLLGPLDFTIDNVQISDFISNDTAFFGVDLCVGRTGTSCNGNPTGLAIDTGATPPTRVPEPITLSLFGAGLAGAAAMRRRKKA
jgi:hypothetical protein